MRNTWKIALAFTLVLGLRGALAQAQLITGNTSAFGGGPIYTWDFATANIAPLGSFVPFGATVDLANGRGLAIGGTEVFYTELTGTTGFGPTDVIRVVPLNNGAGGAQIRTLPNPRSGSGIQDLTFSNSILYALTGYDTQVPIVYGLNLSTGAVIKGPVTIAQPAGTNLGLDGFAVLPNGNFLMNDGDASCIYREYSSVDGHLIGNTINVPGGPGFCTGVDTDGVSLYFLTDFNSITKTDLAGTPIDFNLITGTFDDNDEIKIEDISLVHPVTTITDLGHGHLFFAITNTDDINTAFDIQTELLKCAPNVTPCNTATATVLGTGLKRCVPTTGAGAIVRNIPGTNVDVPFSPATISEPLVSGDVLAFRISTRIGTNSDNTKCALSTHSNATNLRLYYDSVGSPSNFALTIAPNPSQNFYLHSDGGTCSNGVITTDSVGVTTRFLNNIAPTAAVPRCKNSGPIDFNKPTLNANPFIIFSTWTLPPQP